MMQRRHFMQSAAAIGTIGIASTAGCSSLNPFSSDTIDEAVEWLPDPDMIDPDLEHGSVSIEQPSNINDAIEGAEDEGSIQVATIPSDDLEQKIEYDLGFGGPDIGILIGDFDADYVDDRFVENDNYDYADEYDDFEIHTDAGEDDGGAYAIRDDAYIETSRGGEDVIEEVIDAKNGDTDRFTEEVDAAEALADSLDLEHAVELETRDRIENGNPESGDFQNQTGSGIQVIIENDSVQTVTELFVFNDDDDAEDAEDDIDEYLESASFDFVAGTSEPDVDVDDNVLTIEFETPLF